MKKFIAGNEYTCRSVCDHDCIFRYRVISRTAKNVKIEDMSTKEIKSKKVYLDVDGNEMIYPTGQYSMAPILRA